MKSKVLDTLNDIAYSDYRIVKEGETYSIRHVSYNKCKEILGISIQPLTLETLHMDEDLASLKLLIKQLYEHSIKKPIINFDSGEEIK